MENMTTAWTQVSRRTRLTQSLGCLHTWTQGHCVPEVPEVPVMGERTSRLCSNERVCFFFSSSSATQPGVGSPLPVPPFAVQAAGDAPPVAAGGGPDRPSQRRGRPQPRRPRRTRPGTQRPRGPEARDSEIQRPGTQRGRQAIRTPRPHPTIHSAPSACPCTCPFPLETRCLPIPLMHESLYLGHFSEFRSCPSQPIVSFLRIFFGIRTVEFGFLYAYLGNICLNISTDQTIAFFLIVPVSVQLVDLFKALKDEPSDKVWAQTSAILLGHAAASVTIS